MLFFVLAVQALAIHGGREQNEGKSARRALGSPVIGLVCHGS